MLFIPATLNSIVCLFMVSSGGYDLIVLDDAVFRTNVVTARMAKKISHNIHSLFSCWGCCYGLPNPIFLVWEVDCVLNLKHGFGLSVGWLFLIEHGYTGRWVVLRQYYFSKIFIFFYHQNNNRNGIR
jgi:hypothetical protein